MTPIDDKRGRYLRMKRTDLAKELRRRAVVEGWAVSYMTKDALVKVLIYSDSKEGKTVDLPEKYVESLRAKQKAHTTKTARAKKSRSEKYGIENLTRKEAMAHAVNTYPGLRYAGKRVFDEPFESLTGSAHDTRVASVFHDATGREHFLTRAESKALSEYPGANVPKEAFQHAKKSVAAVARAQGKPTLGDLW